MNHFFNKFKPRSIEQHHYKSLVNRYHRQERASYWYWRQRWYRIKFWFANVVFRIRVWKGKQQDNVSVFRILLRAIFSQILLALFLVIGLEILESVIKQIPNPLITSWSNKISLNFDAFSGLVFELIGLIGAFLALYFTAITVVASTVYAEVTDDVRRLLVEEKFGNLYFKTVAVFGVILVFDAGVLAIRDELGVFNLVLIILLASFSILSFVILGIKTLEFFNPIPLLNYLDRDFLKWAEAATSNKPMWNDPSFQYHYQQQAEKVLHTYQNVMALISHRKGMGIEPIKDTTTRALSLLQVYASLKPQYPTESRWFRQKGEFQNWLLADLSEVGVAISTGTGLRQKVINDPIWVENELRKVVEQGLAFLLKNHEWESAIQSLDKWQKTLLYMSFHWSIDEAKYLFLDERELICDSVIQTDEQCIQSDDDYEELGSRLAVLDFSHLAFIQIMLGLVQKLENMSVEIFEQTINDLDWQDKGSIYQTELPRKVIEALEHLQGNVDLELAAEDEVVTPVWYIQQFVAAEFATFIVMIVESFIDDIEKLFAEEAERLISEKCLIFAAHTCGRGIEAVRKGKRCVLTAKKCLDELLIFQKTFGFHLINTNWPEDRWDVIFNRLSRINQKLLVSWGKTVSMLSAIPPTKNSPDMFGRVFNVLGNECMNALLTGDEEFFGQLFESLFLASRIAIIRNQNLLQDREDWIRNKLAIDPIIDAMEISGYALVYTELKDGEFWEPVKQLWDWFFFDDPDKKQMRIEWVAAIAQFKGDVFMSGTPRDLIRTNWMQAFGEHMRSRGIKDDLTNVHFGGTSELAKLSPIVQNIIGIESMPSYDLYKLFLAVYFDEASNTPELNFPDRIKDIQRYIKRSGKNREGEIT